MVKDEKRRWGAILGVREVVKAPSNKMSAAPELNPGDWKWIEFISPYRDGCGRRRENDREGGGQGELGISQRVQRGWRKKEQ